MDKRDWKILYGSANSAVELRTIELLSTETGRYILRDQGKYSLYTLACEQIFNAESYPAQNAVVIGTRDSNPMLTRFIAKEEIPANGFRIRTAQNPAHPEKQLVLIAGADASAALYGAISFLDDVIPSTLKLDPNGITLDEPFSLQFPTINYADAPQTLVRSVFTWGHVIGDFRAYLKNLARMKFNRVILWNEFPPVNAAEVVDYAHSWNIEVFWGFDWGWSTNCNQTDLNLLDAIQQDILRRWHEVWSRLPGDGIYFQSFTETSLERLNGISIAESVVALVNRTVSVLLKERPQLKIIFGLHATSVAQHLPEIAQTDPRLEILWEDCGDFPYSYVDDLPIPEDKRRFTERLLALRKKNGLVYKCQLMQKWIDFVHQSGPYFLGCNAENILSHDIALTSPFWLEYQALWLKKGEKAYEMARLIHEKGSQNVELNLAAQLNGPIRFPTALTGELFWNSEKPYEEILQRVLHRPCLRA